MPLPTIAVAVDIRKTYGIGVLRGIKRWVRTHRNWNLYARNGSPVLNPDDLIGWTGDGVICQIGNSAVVEDLKKRRVPVINVSNRVSGFAIPAVFTDDRLVGKLVAEHFLERGITNIGYVGFEGFTYSAERLSGLQDRLRDAGIVPLICENLPVSREYDVCGPILESWIKSLPKPIGIFATNDERGRQVIFAAERAGFQVPADVAVVGCDNDELQSQLSDVPLSSVELATETIGYRAAQMLDQMMQGEWVSPAPALVPPIGVVTRESSDVMGSRDQAVAKAMEYIQHNSHRELPVADVIKESGVSRRSLEVRFKKLVGRTLQEEIWRAHIEKAKALLIETELPMPEIARQSGFPNASRLSSVFRRETDTTPTKYRRLYRQF